VDDDDSADDVDESGDGDEDEVLADDAVCEGGGATNIEARAWSSGTVGKPAAAARTDGCRRAFFADDGRVGCGVRIVGGANERRGPAGEICRGGDTDN
jgi:hypothetical protein